MGVIERIRPGDIVLFRNTHARGAAQRLFCGTDWDHIGIIVQDLECGENGVPCCGEYTKKWQLDRRVRDSNDPWGKPWHTLEAMGDGVDVYPFSSDQVATFNGVQAVRRLHIPADKRPEAEARLTEFVRQVKGCPYSKRLITLLRAAKYFGENDEEGDLQSFFCSELVATAWKAMGVLPADRNANMYIPGDFSSTGDPARAAALNPGYRLGGEIVLDPSSDQNAYSQDFYKSHPMLPTSPVASPGPPPPTDSAVKGAWLEGKPSAPAGEAPESPAPYTPSPQRYNACEVMPDDQGRSRGVPPPIVTPTTTMHRCRDNGGGVWSGEKRRVHRLPALDPGTFAAQELLDGRLHLSEMTPAQFKETLSAHTLAIQRSGSRPRKVHASLLGSISKAEHEVALLQSQRKAAAASAVADEPFRLPGGVTASPGGLHANDEPPATPDMLPSHRLPDSEDPRDSGELSATHFGTKIRVPLGDGPLTFDDLATPTSALPGNDCAPEVLTPVSPGDYGASNLIDEGLCPTPCSPGGIGPWGTDSPVHSPGLQDTTDSSAAKEKLPDLATA